MTTTIIPFNPSPDTPFQFTALFDGATYTVVLTWNLFGQRYYVNVIDINGVRVFSRAMVGSPPSKNISLTAGYFTTQLVWRVQANQFEIVDV